MRGPSIASCLLRVSTWRDAGGFPEYRAAEDLVFMERLEANGCRVRWAPEASVGWEIAPSLLQTFHRFLLYSRHNVWAGRQRFWHYGIARHYLLVLPFIALGLLYSPWWLMVPVLGFLARVGRSIWRRREGQGLLWALHPVRLAGVGLILAAIDLATFLGWVQALCGTNPYRALPANRSEAPTLRLTSLYLCYQSVLEPLTQTQVIAYLEGLTQAGYRLVLLTFEPRSLTAEETQDHRKHLAAKGIAWHWLRYHKRPTVPATALDILAGIAVGWWLVWKYRIGLLHARIHVPGLMALALKSLTGAPFLFDIRGFMAEEYADAGVWKANGLLFRLTKWVEHRLVRAADGYVVLTQKARDLLQEWYPREIHGKPVQVIPCCIDLRRIPARNGRLGHPDEEKTLGYVLSFIKPCLSKRASSPTKVGEYLAAGLPVAALSGIGDTDTILREAWPGAGPVGILIHGTDPENYREAARQLRILMEDPETPARCRRVAEAHFNLETVGWTRYRELYRSLLSKPIQARTRRGRPSGPVLDRLQHSAPGRPAGLGAHGVWRHGHHGGCSFL